MRNPIGWKGKFGRSWGRLGMKCKLSDIADVTMGQSPKSEFYNSEGDGLPFLQGNRTFGDRYPTFDTWTTSPTKIAEAGDVIMSVRAPVGDLNITPVKMCLGRGVCSIRAKNGCQDFIYYLMQFSMKQLLSKESGTVFGSVNRNDINGLEVNIPEDIETQEKIARFLGCIDEKIEINKSINENLQEQAQALYANMFIQNNSDQWSEGVLSDVAEIIMGQSPKGDTYNEDGVGTVFFQGRGEFGFRFPTRRLFTTDPKRMAQSNDVLMSVRAPVGDLNVAYEPCCIGRGLGAIRSKDGHQSFVLYTVFSLREKLDMFNGEGTVFGSINRDALNSMPIIIPTKDKMDRFEEIVAPMDAAIRNNYEEICRLEAIRDSLLPRLMSGELDVSDIDL